MGLIDSFVKAQSTGERIALLNDIKTKELYLPLSFVQDMLELNLSLEEKSRLIERSYSPDNLAFESFLIDGLSKWHQDIASQAIIKWANMTHHLLWYRFLPILNQSHLAQRIQYTIIANCIDCSTPVLLESVIECQQLFELSSAFHAMVFEKCLIFDIESKRLNDLALETLEKNIHIPWPDNKALPASILWLLKYNPQAIQNCLESSSNLDTHYRTILKTLLEQTESEIKGIASKSKKLKSHESFWPTIISRNKINSEMLSKAVNDFINGDLKTNGFEFFSGCNQSLLQVAVENSISKIEHLDQVKKLMALIKTDSESFKESLFRLFQTGTSPEDILNHLDLKTRIFISLDNSNQSKEFSIIQSEKDQAVKTWTGSKRSKAKEEFFELFDPQESRYPFLNNSKPIQDKDAQERHIFFDLAYRGKTSKYIFEKNSKNKYWKLLVDAYKKPKKNDLEEIAVEARKSEYIYKIAYIDTLRQFKGNDKAALRLLDFVRSKDPIFVESTIKALSGISTPRAIQELIHSLTRSNVNEGVAIEICNLLKQHDLTHLQSELRSTVNDIEVEPNKESIHWEIKETLMGFIVSEPESKLTPLNQNQEGKQKEGSKNSASLDDQLKGKIPYYSALSSEVRRALRTAQFFHTQTKSSEETSSIDLSPAIDMQYKALELLFREAFEDFCFQVITNGILQRKLDVIGYARPIIQQMDNFENFISKLPIICEIPYFSKFKLRKMLRSICQFRPGKRFTLDGIKAFALFFLCFGRKNCKYGLANIVDLGFKENAELFEFCKALHMFQDFRNRATHEGFHPEARKDIDGIWQSTAEIIQTVSEIKEYLANDHLKKDKAS